MTLRPKKIEISKFKCNVCELKIGLGHWFGEGASEISDTAFETAHVYCTCCCKFKRQQVKGIHTAPEASKVYISMLDCGSEFLDCVSDFSDL